MGTEYFLGSRELVHEPQELVHKPHLRLVQLCNGSYISSFHFLQQSAPFPNNMSDMHHVGRRLSYASARCTVRYFGEVQGTTGEWLGVEWDDHSRGKHDGSHGGVKYFDCMNRKGKLASILC